MIISFLVGFGIGMLIGAVIDIVIDVKAFDEDNNHVANVTFNAQQGSSLITNNSY